MGSDEFHTRSTPGLPVQATGKNLAKVNKATAKAEQGKPGYRAEAHKGSIQAWENVYSQLKSSHDPEVTGYLQYLHDVAAGKAPNLDGQFKPDLLSTWVACGAGLARRTCNPGPADRLRTVWSDPHVLGLAIDIAGSSNRDIRVKGAKGSRKVNGHIICKNYKKTIDKMKAGDFGQFFTSDPYNMYKRLDPKIDDCLANKYAFWSVPDGWIDIFVKNNFYFAGWGWSDPKRADGMHHEFYGNCFELKGRQVE